MNLKIAVEVRANVAVLESKTQREHYPDLSARAALPDQAIDWIKFHWFDEETLPELIDAMGKGCFSAVLIASGCLQLATVRSLLNSPVVVASMRNQIARGMGLIVISTFVGDETGEALSFLPSGMRLQCRAARKPIPSNLAIRPSARARIDGIIAPVKDSLPQEVSLPKERGLLSVLVKEATSHHNVLAESDMGEILMASSIASHGRVFVTTLPLDQLRSHALHSLLIRAVRATGILVVCGQGEQKTSGTGTSDWLSEQPSNAYLVRLALPDGYSPTKDILATWPYTHFGHVVFDGGWTWDSLSVLDADAIARRVENWGSVTAKVTVSPKVSYWLSLSGETSVLRRAQRHAAWMSQNSEKIVTAPLLVMRAACSVATAVTRALFDAEESPHMATPKHLAGLLEDALRGRLDGGSATNVDGLLLPTAALVSIADSLAIQIPTMPSIRKWLADHAMSASSASLLQAAAWFPPLRQHPAVVAAVSDGMLESHSDVRLHAMAVGLACFPGVGRVLPDLHSSIHPLIRSEELSPLGKALLIESVLAAAREWSSIQVEHSVTLEGIAQSAAGELRAIVGAALAAKDIEIYMVATSSLLYLERGAALGYRDLKIGHTARLEATVAHKADDNTAQVLLNAEVESRRLARLLKRAESEKRRRERMGTLLLVYGVSSTTLLVVLLSAIYWSAVSGLLFGEGGPKEILWPTLLAILGLVWYLLYRAFAPVGFIPKWLPGPSLKTEE